MTTKVLVIDDERDSRDTTSAALRAAGYDVVAAKNGDEGLSKVRADNSTFDLVITDILMPEKDGLETIAELKAEFPKVRIIAMTGGGLVVKSTGRLLAAAEQIGADALLMKPFTTRALYRKVASTLTARSL
jgi:CheY-like chemotaxis protein